MKKTVALFLALLLIVAVAAASAETTVIRMTCAGDALLGCNEFVRGQDYSYDHYIDQYGYAYPFEKLQCLFANDDITLVNLEVVLAEEANPASAKSHFNFRGYPRYTEILKQGSVEVVNLANNHSMDHGQAAFDETVAALDAAGIKYCGSTDGGSYSCIMEVKGIKIGFVGILPLYYSNHNHNENNGKQRADVKARFDELKEAGCALIVCSLHCGKEYLPQHDDIHIKYEKIAMSLGADLIIGTHPHVPQGIRINKNVVHVFSLGNSSFGGNTGVDETLSCQDAIITSFDLYFEDGVFTGSQMTIWPIHITGSYPVNDYQPVLVEGDEAQAVMKKVQKDTQFKLNPYVDGQGAVQDFVPAPVHK